MFPCGGLPQLLLPWEIGPMAVVFGASTALQHVAEPAAIEVYRAAARDGAAATAPAAAAAARVVSSPALPGRRRDPGPTPDADDVEAMERAVDRWAVILAVAREAAPIWVKTGGASGPLRLSIRDALAAKAPSTAVARAGALLGFCRWCTSAGFPPFPAREAEVYDYVVAVRPRAASTAKRFLEALAFGGGLFELQGALDAISPRVRGGAVVGLKRKRPTLKKLVYRADHLILLEGAMADPVSAGLSDLESSMLGLLLFRIHARARCSDVVRARVEPTLDVEGSAGYVETVAAPREHKRAMGASAGRSLPLVAHAFGVTGLPWASKWLEKRRVVGIDAATAQCLQPVILCDGSLGSARMSTGEVLRWDKWVLAKVGVEPEFVAVVGTHSAKSTLLSWAAKAGLRHGWRRLLGGHAAGKDKSMLEYSRDALAQPLRELEGLLEAVRIGKFRPDATRSGRWSGAAASGPAVPVAPATPPAASEGAGPLEAARGASENTECASCRLDLDEGDGVELCDGCAAAVHPQIPCYGECSKCSMHYCLDCRPGAEHVCDEGVASSSAPTSESSEGEDEEVKVAAVAEAELAVEFQDQVPLLPPLPAEGLVRHVVTQVVHRAAGVGVGIPQCNGRGEAASLEWVAEWPACPWPLCHRKGCFFRAAS